MKQGKNIGRVILIFVATSIWGAIAFRLLPSSSSAETLNTMVETQSKTKAAIETLAKDSLKLNYTDPFTKKVLAKKTKSASPKPKLKPKVTEKEPLPEIVYHGMIRNKSRKTTQAWVSVNGEEKVIQTGEKIGGLEFISVTPNQLTIRFNHDTKTIDKTGS